MYQRGELPAEALVVHSLRKFQQPSPNWCWPSTLPSKSWPVPQQSGMLPCVFCHSPGKILTKYAMGTYDQSLHAVQRLRYFVLQIHVLKRNINCNKMILRVLVHYTVAFNFLVCALTEMCQTFLNMLVVTQLAKKCSFILKNPKFQAPRSFSLLVASPIKYILSHPIFSLKKQFNIIHNIKSYSGDSPHASCFGGSSI